MHTRIPELHGEDLTRSMGMFAVWWIETFFRVGRGGGVGLPEAFDMDEYVFMLHAYALTEWVPAGSIVCFIRVRRVRTSPVRPLAFARSRVWLLAGSTIGRKKGRLTSFWARSTRMRRVSLLDVWCRCRRFSAWLPPKARLVTFSIRFTTTAIKAL